MIKTIIIEDEQDSQELIKKLIRIKFPELEIQAITSNIKSSIDQINRLDPELVFLDIELEDGTAFEILKQLDKINFVIIFITAYENFALAAFKFDAIDYLLKPFSVVDFEKAVEKAKKYIQNDRINQKWDIELANSLSNLLPQRLVISTAKGVTINKLSEVINIVADRSYCKIIKSDGKEIIVSKSLKEISNQIKNPQFMRIHQSHLINIDHVEEYISNDGGYVLMSNESRVPISKKYKSNFLNLLKS